MKITNQIENINQRKICRTCVVIRFFIIAMLLLLIVAILAKDQMQHLSFLTTWKVAIAIMAFGSISFLIKFLFWKLEKKNNSNDLSQND